MSANAVLQMKSVNSQNPPETTSNCFAPFKANGNNPEERVCREEEKKEAKREWARKDLREHTVHREKLKEK